MEHTHIQPIDADRHVDDVIALGRANKKTLGPFPDEAFVRYANEGNILTSLGASGGLQGYLLYHRTKRDEFVIIHLCVAKSHRHKNVGKALVAELSEIAKREGKRGIRLKCRREYESAIRLWRDSGFVARTEVRGRSKAGIKLVCFWKGINDKTLFSEGRAPLGADKLAVVDMNVFVDIADEAGGKTAEASKALLADWLAGMIRLGVADELFNEILMADSSDLRRRRHDFATANFDILPREAERFDKAMAELATRYPVEGTDQDKADIRHLADAIAADADFFVTRDGDQLARAEEIVAAYGLRIMRPATLIATLDEQMRASDYQPARFAGSNITVRAVRTADIEEIIRAFQDSRGGERKSDVLRTMEQGMSAPGENSLQVVQDSDGEYLAVLSQATPTSDPESLVVSLLRVCRGRMATTVANQMVRQILLTAAQGKCRLVSVTDAHLQEEALSALSDFGFVDGVKRHDKICLYGIEAAEQVATKLEGLPASYPFHQSHLARWAKSIRGPGYLAQPECALREEHALWPLKFDGVDVPAYIVSIKPDWAMHLFDAELAAADLFGRQVDLALNTEGVYYNAANITPKAPGRILWYVSGSAKDPKNRQLRACSRLLHVDVGRPKELFRKYRRLGIWEWHHLTDLVKNDLSREIKALHFDDTFSFPSPIGFDELNGLLGGEGITSPLLPPTHISSDVFAKLYRRATR